MLHIGSPEFNFFEEGRVLVTRFFSCLNYLLAHEIIATIRIPKAIIKDNTSKIFMSITCLYAGKPNHRTISSLSITNMYSL